MNRDQTGSLLEQCLAKSRLEFEFDYAIVDMRQMMRRLHSLTDGTEMFLSRRELERLNQFNLPKKKLQWVSGRYAVKKAFYMYQKVRGVTPDLKRIDLLAGENGAPLLVQFPEVQVSLTHSYPFCIGTVSNRRIGVDLEKVAELPASMMNYYFHPAEMEYLTRQTGRDEYTIQAIRYWTRKEAVSKLLGLGMKMGFKEVDTVSDELILDKYSSISIKLHSYPVAGFYLSLASEGVPLSAVSLNGLVPNDENGS